VWDPLSGGIRGIRSSSELGFELEPYESRIVFFSSLGLAPASAENRLESKRIDVSHDWSVTFEGQDQAKEMHSLTSWAEDARLRFYSGVAAYRKTIDIAESDLRAGHTVALDFGDGVPVTIPDPLPHFNMRAYLESPVREAAQIFVNDKPAGYVWHPPYLVELTRYLKPGENEVRIVVGNTAINELAGVSLPNYRLLRDRYGVLFEPQDMKDLEPLPSGILGQLTLIESSSAR
jgi:hypothetical protein